MFSLQKLVSMGFSLEKSTKINKLFKRVGYAAAFTASDLVENVSIPDDKIFQIDDVEGLKQIFKSSTQFYTDIETILVQRGNSDPFQSDIETVVVYQVTETKTVESETVLDWATAIDNFITTNANFGQLVISSRDVDDIQAVSAKAQSNARLFVAQSEDSSLSTDNSSNPAKILGGLNMDNTLIFYHPTIEFIAGGIAGILAQHQLGLAGPLFATVTNCTPQNYSSTISNVLESVNVSSYQYVNPVNGGGVSEYATPIVYPGKQVTGLDTKRKYIMFSIDLLMKAGAVDFLARAYNYEDSSAKILESKLSSILRECQIGDGLFKRLVKEDTIKSDGTVVRGFEIRVGKPSDLQDAQPSLYSEQAYPVAGYYRDALTGRKVKINLMVDPSNATLQAAGFLN